MEATNPVVRIKTGKGEISLELDANAAPLTVANFLAYARSGHYDGTIFHRVIPGFMIQGGGMNADMKEKSTQAPIKNEAANGLKNTRGTIAMARTSVVDSATSQFFINLVDSDFLDHSAPTPRGFGYAVFGRVTAGMETVDAIARVATGSRGAHADVPTEPVIIESVTVVE
jgi:peptidyl-prolyl cis-trans isomerase B (cyclophilin B)